MGDFELTQSAAAKPEAVFQAFTDFAWVGETVPAIQKIEVLTPGPTAVGSKFQETRVVFGMTATEAFEIAEFDPPRHYRLTCESCGCRYQIDYDFTPQGDDACLVRFRMQIRSTTWKAKLFAPLGWLTAGSMKRQLQEDLRILCDAAAKRSTGGSST